MTPNKKTGIVGTIGPVSSTREAFEELVRAGLTVARLNGSHNTLEWHAETISMIRSVDPMIPILVDLPGRKVRTQTLSAPKEFLLNDKIIFTTHPNPGTADKIPVNYPNLHNDLKAGDIILADDATLRFEVLRIEGHDIVCSAHCNGTLKSCKGLNIPFVRVNTPLVTDRDREVIKFCIQQKIDFVGVSFVESSEHVRQIKALLGDSGIQVISKIENRFGIENLDSIISESDALLIDRGDLGAETRVQSVGVLQKNISSRANTFGIPVIFATEMLHSMIENPVPTKAEVSDITNAVLDGASAVMLSGETAVGRFPVLAVKEMAAIVLEAEAFFETHVRSFTIEGDPTVANAIGKSVYEVASHVGVTQIVCISYTGYAAKMISRYRLKQPIRVVTDSIEKARKLNLLWGVSALALDVPFSPENTQNVIMAVHELWKLGILTVQDHIIAVSARYPYAGSKMNAMEIHAVENLARLFNWETMETRA